MTPTKAKQLIRALIRAESRITDHYYKGLAYEGNDVIPDRLVVAETKAINDLFRVMVGREATQQEIDFCI